MHKLSVPLMSSTINAKNREIYLQQCREAGVARIFLVCGSVMEKIPDTLAENVEYFKSRGFEVGVWTDTIGHGMVLKHVENSIDNDCFSPIVDITGRPRAHAYCPMDKAFSDYISGQIAELAKTGADIVMLDDDFRMSQHGHELCCACPEHLRRIEQILGEEVKIAQLRSYVLLGKPNKYRDAWLRAQNEGLIALAKEIRAAVDQQTPDVTVCFCTAYAPWNVDGTDVVQITRILAGINAPILRLTGAPYWAVKHYRYPLITTFEIARMLAAFVSEEGFELMSEGDVYPRPRYTCPSSYLELFDAVTCLDGGYDGILKYMFDYVAGPEVETGYLNAHNKNSAYREQVSHLFGTGANSGVRIIAFPHTLEHADCDLTTPSPVSPCPFDGTMLGSCGIPTIYRGKGVCNCAFGDHARLVDVSACKDGMILDAVSALILTERGIDVGLESAGMLEEADISFLYTKDPSYKSYITDGSIRRLSARLKESAEPVLLSPEGIVAYRYENREGERFLVFLFEGDSARETGKHVFITGLTKNPVVQKILIENIPWVARKKLSAFCQGNPELYIMCAQEENAMSVALFNCFADPLNNPVVELGDHYDSIECVGCQAVLDGDRVTITSPVYGFTSVAFRVYHRATQ